jgi:folate-binding protein YgfZ
MANNENSLTENFAESIFYYPHEDGGFLRISGEDRHSFLQRQTTNDLELLSPDRSLVTVLTSSTGRILDVLWVIDEGDSLGVLTLPGNGQETLNFLQSRIFFMDKVSVEDASEHYAQIDLFGDGIIFFLTKYGSDQSSIEDVILKLEISGIPVTLLNKKEFALRLLVPKEAKGKVLEGFDEQGAKSLSTDQYEILRIEAGLPVARHELTEDYTPLETGFDWAVSDNKGCYTGQEVIARQVNYDKVTRKLVGLKLSQAVRLGDTLYPPDSQQPVGKITSIADSPRYGRVALAIIKRPYYEVGNELVSGEKGKATTSSLPFS